ncbi:KICSTOR subunit 2-like [Lycorma delicatula]|uniref:KICSTOR subunit 2-like n=1 Tax=Lycorma delicatula TaxID=130591 RepID=UPI003F511A68
MGENNDLGSFTAARQFTTLSIYFSHLSQLNFDKARELVEKERDAEKIGSYRQLLILLPNLIVTERSYIELAFVSVKNKIFLRKDNSLRSMYESLRSEINKIEFAETDNLLLDVVTYLGEHIAARIQLIDLYEKMYALGSSNKPMKCNELITQISGVGQFSVTNDITATIRSSFSLECEILRNLLEALVELQNWQFLSCLTHLHIAHTHLTSWEKSLQSREYWKLGFLKGSQLPALYLWLVKLKSSIVGKFSLYFHHILVQQTTPHDMRVLCSKHNIDHMHRLHSLQRKYDAKSIMLIFSVSGGDDLMTTVGPGYQHPERAIEPLDEYTIMLGYPMKLADKLPTVGKAITDRRTELTTSDRVICCYSPKEQYTYFMSNIDPRITLVVVFDSKKDDRETSICNHISELAAQFRSNRVFANLKLNKKSMIFSNIVMEESPNYNYFAP